MKQVQESLLEYRKKKVPIKRLENKSVKFFLNEVIRKIFRKQITYLI